jgi:hypothetical protein
MRRGKRNKTEQEEGNKGKNKRIAMEYKRIARKGTSEC